jgi:putative ATP-binding cassette transporter
MLIYTAIIDALPNAAIVSVAHRESVSGFHENRIEIERAGAETLAV